MTVDLEAVKKPTRREVKEAVKVEMLARAKLLNGQLVRGVLLTIDEAAEYIRMGPSTLYQKRYKIPHFSPPNGRILFDSAALDDWLKNSMAG